MGIRIMFSGGNPLGQIRRVLFLGSKQLGLRVLEEVHRLSPDVLAGVVTIDDRQDCRTKYSEFREYARAHGLRLTTVKTAEESETVVRQANADLGLVVGWYWLISEATLRAARHGLLGVHNSLLPKYRGSAPLVWQIINGEREVGASLFSFGAGMDDGPVWAQARVSIGEDDYMSEVLTRLELSTVQMMRDVWPKILFGGAEPREQDHAQATFCAQRFPSDGNIDWSMSAREVYNHVRAQADPYPGAYSYFGKARLTIWKATVFPRPYLGAPGQIGMAIDKGVCVTCGKGTALVVEEVEVDGQRRPALEVVKPFRRRLSSVPKR